ncbi:MAG: hypothetical protein PHE17_00300 [Thiothrix sp.]|uniref:hypothetical protein n=1 Tax=Thiothrix sp. TaxID=1032 RepID=UPI0026068974|nr:hypothetical protein [Thiothrix sp.]MDD5391432.1 hypothetical protein [Thiothrix sp.]
MERNSQLTLAQMLARLAQILGWKQSGTFFIATDANTSCRFSLESGKITHCTHGRDHGVAAIHSLLNIGGGSCSFSESQFVPFRAEAAIPHQSALDILGICPVLPFERPIEKAPLPAAIPATAPTRVNNRFYRGGYSA